jgi:hypothetical protein
LLLKEQMKTYKIAVFNWYDETIDIVYTTASSGLAAMEEVLILPEVGTMTEEAYCQKEIMRGGFIGYEECLGVNIV